MSKGFAEASQGPVLDKKCLVPKIQVFTGFLCCLFRIGTFSNLRFDLLEGRLQTMLALFQSGIAGRRSLGKGGSIVKSGDICLAWCSNSLRIGRGTLPIGAPKGLGEIHILAKSVFSSCILSS